MKRVLLVVAAAMALGGALAPAAGAAGPYGFTTGGVKVHTHANWSAHDDPNGVSGHMTLMFRDKTEMHANVECVSFGQFFGAPAASVLGRIYKTDNELSQVGDLLEFEVVDADDGNGPGDEFGYTLTNDPNQGPPPDCVFQGNSFPVIQGNTRVEPPTP